jgi:lipoate-protein ligase A
MPDPARCEIWQHDVTSPALVLGSTQDDSIVDAVACRRAGVDVVRRRSGGGAVLLRPGEVTWIDVIVPAGTTGWATDVHAPMVWLGQLLGRAFAGSVGAGTDLVVHEGSMVSTAWSSMICFDGVGAGEVLVDGRKLVGISQRRVRHAARLQCCWYARYEPDELIGLLDAELRPSVADLAPVATVPVAAGGAAVAALVEQLA